MGEVNTWNLYSLWFPLCLIWYTCSIGITESNVELPAKLWRNINHKLNYILSQSLCLWVMQLVTHLKRLRFEKSSSIQTWCVRDKALRSTPFWSEWHLTQIIELSYEPLQLFISWMHFDRSPVVALMLLFPFGTWVGCGCVEYLLGQKEDRKDVKVCLI